MLSFAIRLFTASLDNGFDGRPFPNTSLKRKNNGEKNPCQKKLFGLEGEASHKCVLHKIHAWYTYLTLDKLSGKCRFINMLNRYTTCFQFATMWLYPTSKTGGLVNFDDPNKGWLVSQSFSSSDEYELPNNFPTSHKLHATGVFSYIHHTSKSKSNVMKYSIHVACWA